jgi:acyl-CoA thioester hydrolase
MAVTMPLEIRFVDIDRLQHVNNAHYLTYFEQARLKYFEEVIGGSIDWSETGIILANAEINFLRPILLQDKVTVDIWISRIGNKSFDFNYQINTIGEKGNYVSANGKTVMVCINYKTMETIAMPTEWLEKVRKYENML